MRMHLLLKTAPCASWQACHLARTIIKTFKRSAAALEAAWQAASIMSAVHVKDMAIVQRADTVRYCHIPG